MYLVMKARVPAINQKLLTIALTHRSYLNEHKTVKEHNERLEFLGDAVLELVTSQYIFEKYPDKPEGEMTALRSALVRTTTLAEVAEKLKLGDQLRLSRGEAASGGRENRALLANTFEAVLGALYLDQDLTAVREFLTTWLFPELATIVTKELYRDYKSTLQEEVQAEGQPSPVYEVVSEVGPDHDKQFTIRVMVGTRELAAGSGKSKQAGQQEAARRALEKLAKG